MANVDPSWRYSWCYYPNQHIVQRGWRILTPHEDKDDGSDDGDDDDDHHHDHDHDHDDCKRGATSGLGRTCYKSFFPPRMAIWWLKENHVQTTELRFPNDPLWNRSGRRTNWAPEIRGSNMVYGEIFPGHTIFHHTDGCEILHQLVAIGNSKTPAVAIVKRC